MNRKQILSEILKHKTEIKRFGVKKLVLVGSYAHDRAQNKSDIDFLVEFEQGRGLFDDYVHLLHFLEDLFNKPIDLGDIKFIRDELKQHMLGGKQIEAKI